MAKTSAVQHLHADIVNFSVDIALVVETWFKAKHSDAEISIPGYTLYRRDRVGKRKGGGLCAYVKSGISCSVLNLEQNNQEIEIMWLALSCSSYSIIVCVCYHPPTPVYHTAEFVDLLKNNIDAVADKHTADFIFLCGDFNSLDTNFIDCDCGFTQIVNVPTHGNKIIDKVFINRPDQYSCKVCKSVVKTKHKLVIISPTVNDVSRASASVRRKYSVYDTRAPNIDRLRFALGTYDWSYIYDYESFDEMYSEFLTVIKETVQCCVPCKTVSIGTKEAYYITPVVKSLLKKRNGLRRQGRLEEADAIAIKINNLISEQQRKRLINSNKCNSKEMWKSVKSCSQSSTDQTSSNIDAEKANNFFAQISSDKDYSLNKILALKNPQASDHHDLTDVFIDEYTMEPLLRKLKNTSPGNDAIPCWVFKSCSYELAAIVSYLIKKSFATGTVPASWHTAIVTPIPKVSNPQSPSDYRPISVTPILSRLAEKLLVKIWLKPVLPYDILCDQYAYKDTGSTVGAIIDLLHFITQSLDKGNNYVRCIFIDFSKAFDTINHEIIITKVNELNLPNNIKNWIISFLVDRSQIVKSNNVFSKKLNINKGVIQGSALGPFLYLILQMSLKALGADNKLIKYADDTVCAVPEKSSVSVVSEYNNIKGWAGDNFLTINEIKTYEVVFSLLKPSVANFLPTFSNIQLVNSIKYLGVILSGNLGVVEHINATLSLCSQRLYLLKLLRDGGMPIDCLHIVFLSLVLNRICYCLPAWGGFVRESDVCRINSLFKRAKKWGFTPTTFDFNGLCRLYDEKLLDKMRANELHSLYHILPPQRTNCKNLRTASNFTLPKCRTEVHRKSFLPRTLYNVVFN